MTHSFPLRVIGALCWGLVVFVALTRLGVYPSLTPVVAGGVLAALAIAQPRVSYLIGVVLFGFGLFYASPALAVWFAACIILLEFVAEKSAAGNWTRMLAVAMPALCDIQIFSANISFETVALLAIPLFVAKNAAVSAVAGGMILTLLTGIVQQKLVFGHFIATRIAQAPFFRPHPGAMDLTDFDWLGTAWTSQSTQALVKIPVAVSKLLLGEPQLLMMVAGSAAAAFVMAAGREARAQRGAWVVYPSYLAGVGLLTAGYYGTTHFQIFTPQTYYWFAGLNAIGALVLLIAAEILVGGSKTARSKALAPSLSQPIAQPVSDAEKLKKKELNLEETLKMQAQLKDYIQKEFVKQTTAVDIDIAGSSAMKEGEDSVRVVPAFAEFWKRVDEKMLQWSGKLLNRAGDGAIFLFEDADRAVQAARDALKSVREFNAKGNGLKLPFKVRIGMHTGELMTDKQTAGGEVFSRVLDISGHLQKAAETDEIRISEDTHKALKTSRGFQPAGTLAKDNIPTFSLKL